LKSVSSDFAEWWPRHDVLPQSEGSNATTIPWLDGFNYNMSVSR
jgi:hypothetical protein